MPEDVYFVNVIRFTSINQCLLKIGPWKAKALKIKLNKVFVDEALEILARWLPTN